VCGDGEYREEEDVSLTYGPVSIVPSTGEHSPLLPPPPLLQSLVKHIEINWSFEVGGNLYKGIVPC
jgi:hypothetical protein